MSKFDSSYDRQQAKSLAQRLTETAEQGALASPLPITQTSAPVAISLPAIEASVPDIRFEDQDTFRDEVWHMLLDWALDASASETAFVCDANGLVICAVGKRDHSAEELASVAVTARVHLKRCSAQELAPQLCAFQWPEWSLTMMTIGEPLPPATHPELMIGLVGPSQPEPQVLSLIGRIFKDKLAGH